MGGRVVIENVTYAYRRRQVAVLKELSVVIPAGTTFGLVGRNGSGKTMLFGLILGMLRPRRGRVIVQGQTGNPLSPGDVGFLPERPYYHDEFRLVEYLEFLSRVSPRPCSQQEVDQIIERVDLGDARNVFPAGLL